MLKARGLYVGVCEYAENYGFGEDASHFHRHYEIYYLIKGRRRYIIEEEIYDIQTGDIVLIPPMVMHKTQRFPAAPVEERHQRLLYNLNEIPEELLPLFKRHFYRPAGKAAEKIRGLVEESVEAGDKSKLFHKLNAQMLLFTLLDSADSSTVQPELSSKDMVIKHAACYIKENCEKPLTLKQVADEAGFAREYFSVAFKKAIGSNFIDYLNNMRVARAMHILSETELPVSAVSEKCGFNDSNYFANVFKKITGVTPTRYRNLK